MNWLGWFLTESVIKREFYNGYYFVMFIIMILAIVVMFRARLVRFSVMLWVISGLINLVWEASLYLSGSRQYTFIAGFELFYHVLTEAGPGLIIMVLAAERLKIIELAKFHDGVWRWK